VTEKKRLSNEFLNILKDLLDRDTFRQFVSYLDGVMLPMDSQTYFEVDRVFETCCSVGEQDMQILKKFNFYVNQTETLYNIKHAPAYDRDEMLEMLRILMKDL